METAYLTKSDYLNHRVCPGYCWLKRHRPELVLVEDDSITRRRLLFGNRIDKLARSRYPSGKTVETPDVDSAAAETRGLMLQPDVDVIFQAAVVSDAGFVARADILARDGESWRLIEVKSATSIDADHIADATFQALAFEAAEYAISSVSLLHLSKDYRRSGVVDRQLLFAEDDITAKIDKLKPVVHSEMDAALIMLRSNQQPSTCGCIRKTRSNHCPTFRHFHPTHPVSGSVYEIQGLRVKKLAELLDRGILMLSEMPDDIELSAGQRLQVTVHRSGKALVDRAGLASLLARCAFPLYFLDYESSSVPIPMYDGCWPYQQVPFQYSLHIVHANGEQLHRELLATERGINPLFQLFRQLQSEIGAEGAIVVWNASFERARNKEAARCVVEAAQFLENLNERMVDLMEAVSKHNYVQPDFRGSASIKAVLPVAAPDLSYRTLDIQDGASASERWLACMIDEVSDAERETAFSALRDYCRLDTLAMVRVWRHLNELLQTSHS